nr:cob(I)yrinic acid a,c-diamide adenosyltransferase [Oceanobacter mangrovi]
MNTDQSTLDINAEHKAKMQQQQAIVRERIKAARENRGTLIVITGHGKGKSTSGFGTITRALGYDYKTAVVQFVKGNWPCGERDLLKKLGVPFHVMGTGFTWDTQDREKDIAAAKLAWQASKEFLADPDIHVLLLDELTYMLSYEYLDLDEVLEALANRPKNMTVVVTGRDAHPRLVELADTVSEVQPVKHAFEAGIKARKGVDW